MLKVIASVKALIRHEDKFLILKEALHKGDVWDLPGGKIEYGEAPLDALKREVKEELDLDVQVLRPLGMWYFFSQTHKHQVICNTFLCKLIGKLKIDTSKNPADEDIIGYQWLTKVELLESKEVKLHESLIKLIKEQL